MNRQLTNWIRIVMDNYIPKKLRNSYWFMYPFFFIAYRGKNIKQVMHFKKNVRSFSAQKYVEFYQNLDSISRSRDTDLSASNISYILNHIDKSAKTLLDVGCGKGFLLNAIQMRYPGINLSGFDVVNVLQNKKIQFHKGDVTSLPFADNSFEIVVCTHTIEHIINLEKAVAELMRVTQKQLIVVTPCQKYFYYTLDEHLNFFEKKEDLTKLFKVSFFKCIKLHGDWIYIGYLDKQATSLK